MTQCKKSRELILHRRHGLVSPVRIPDVERVSTMKVLCVTLRDDLNASTHITGVLEACARSLYELRIPRSHGLPPKALYEVSRSTTLGRLLYCTLLLRGGVSPVQTTGCALLASSEERSEWVTYHPTPSMLQPWLPTRRTVC